MFIILTFTPVEEAPKVGDVCFACYIPLPTSPINGEEPKVGDVYFACYIPLPTSPMSGEEPKVGDVYFACYIPLPASPMRGGGTKGGGCAICGKTAAQRSRLFFSCSFSAVKYTRIGINVIQFYCRSMTLYDRFC